MRLPRLAALLAMASLVVASQAAAAPLVPDETPAFNDWLRGVQARVAGSSQKAVGFPRSARFVVSMFIHPDGSVSDIRDVSASDPDPRFAALASRVVELAGPFPPIPPSAHHDDGAEITVPLAFNVIAPPKPSKHPSKHRPTPKTAHASGPAPAAGATDSKGEPRPPASGRPAPAGGSGPGDR